MQLRRKIELRVHVFLQQGKINWLIHTFISAPEQRCLASFYIDWIQNGINPILVNYLSLLPGITKFWIVCIAVSICNRINLSFSLFIENFRLNWIHTNAIFVFKFLWSASLSFHFNPLNKIGGISIHRSIWI